MQITITQVTDVKPDSRGGMSSKIHAGNDQYFVNQDATNLNGKTVEISYEEKTSKKGNKYKVANILKVIEAQSGNGNGNGAVHWAAYHAMMRLAYAAAVEVEPDISLGCTADGIESKVDRSKARAAIVNTVMIAFTNGKLKHDELDDDIPF